MRWGRTRDLPHPIETARITDTNDNQRASRTRTNGSLINSIPSISTHRRQCSCVTPGPRIGSHGVLSLVILGRPSGFRSQPAQPTVSEHERGAVLSALLSRSAELRKAMRCDAPGPLCLNLRIHRAWLPPHAFSFESLSREGYTFLLSLVRQCVLCPAYHGNGPPVSPSLDRELPSFRDTVTTLIDDWCAAASAEPSYMFQLRKGLDSSSAGSV